MDMLLRSPRPVKAKIPRKTSHLSPQVDGKFLAIAGQRFWARGVTYGSFRSNDHGEPFPPFAQLIDDFAQMRDSGVNTVRIYSPPSDRIADAAAKFGLHLVPDFCWGPRRCELDDPDRVRFIFDWTRQHSRRLAGHPAILLHCIGNEIPPLVVRWYGRERIEQFLKDLSDVVREESPGALVTYVNHPPTEHLHLPFLDVVSYNVYLERESDFRKYLARLQSLAGDRPVFLAELGLDAGSHGTDEQQRVLRWQLQAVFEKALCGAAVYSWTDEWSIFSQDIEGWSFGLTDADRRPRPALKTVQEIYTSDLYSLRDRQWPRVSIIVASYNGGRTLDECLRSLMRLSYPDYEIIVIDDGSTDDTPQIVTRFNVRTIRTENRGLSAARNLGIESSIGEIVAFIDSDAYADPDWLFHLVTTLADKGASGVGGPNLSPPDDGFVAACVDFAPGNPTHVLVDDERAEHVPGCNMAFRKDALGRIGGFDHTHRAAGDDVDVCWKLLVRDEPIAFSPGAFVWHHRRPTVRAYLRQQRGYGYAEAHLRRRYPGRFNVFGDLVWSGSIYDGLHTELRQQGIAKPVPLSGLSGPVWQCSISSALSAVPGMVVPSFHDGRVAGFLLVHVGGRCAEHCVRGSNIGDCRFSRSNNDAAGHARRSGGACCPRRSPATIVADPVLGRAFLLITALQILQPLARAWGHVIGAWRTRGSPPIPSVRRLYGNLVQRETWLTRLERHAQDCGWSCQPSSDWDVADLDILGPGPYRLQLCSVYEDDVEHGRHFVRYRVTARPKRWLPLVWFAMVSAVPVFFWRRRCCRWHSPWSFSCVPWLA